LIELPDLPDELELLWCYNNNLTYIPELPKSLLMLRCNDNKLIELPELPESLEYLDGDNNNIKYLSPVNCQMIKIINEVYLKNNPLTSDFMDTMDFIGSL
jgi:Leucine-rich repeat (LRR) protein